MLAVAAIAATTVASCVSLSWRVLFSRRTTVMGQSSGLLVAEVDFELRDAAGRRGREPRADVRRVEAGRATRVRRAAGAERATGVADEQRRAGRAAVLAD